MYQLKIITSTIREGRLGPYIAQWVKNMAAAYPEFTTEIIDLGTWNLPLNTEPCSPALKQYKYEHTKKWSGTIDQADAFIFVLTEYNHSYPAPIKNALDYLVHEWAYKPAGIVSYAGLSGGTRAVNDLTHVLAALKIVTLYESVHLTQFHQYLNMETGAFHPGPKSENAARHMLEKLIRWTGILKKERAERHKP